MKKIINIKSILLISTFITFFSCYEDKGNYDYVDINVVSINIGEKDSVFHKISKVDTLRISPDLSATMDPNINNDTVRYSFQWSLGEQYTSKNLVYPVDLSSRDYEVELAVTDNVTKLVTIAKWTVIVTDLYQKGYIILTENEKHEAQLDMISVFGDTVVLKNVSNNDEMPIIKNPRRLFSNSVRQNNEIYIMGEGETRKLDRTKFTYNSITGNFKDNFVDPGLYRDFNVTDIIDVTNSSGTRFSIVDGDAFKAITYGTVLFDYPINRYYGKFTTYKVADKLSVNYEFGSDGMAPTNIYVIMYNTDENRFTFLNKNSAVADSLKDTKNDIGIFSWKTGLSFVTSVHSYFGNGDNFTILKDNKGGYFIYQYTIRGTVMQSVTPLKVGKYDVSNAPGIANAKHFCFSANQPFFFYGSGSKIYGYNYIRNITTFEMDMGGEVTYLYDNPKFEGGKDFIYIASYGGIPNSGKLVKKHIINNPNIIGLEDPVDDKGNPAKFEYTGLNRIIDLMYKNN